MSSSSESSSSDSSYHLAIDYGFGKQNVDQTKLWDSANCNDSCSTNFNYDEDADYVVNDEKDESYKSENNKPQRIETTQAIKTNKSMNRNSNITKRIMSGLVYVGITFLFAILIYNFKK